MDLFLITRDGRQIGNGFIGHSGRVATYVLISGLYSSDAEMFAAAIASKLDAAESYDPEAPGEAPLVAGTHGPTE